MHSTYSYQDDSNLHSYPLPSSQQSISSEKGGLIPITAHIFNQATINQDEAIEFKRVLLSDICIVGYITNFKRLDTRLVIDLWDQTGTLSITFFYKNEEEKINGIGNFVYDETRKPVKIFGTVKVYKNDKNLQGARIISVDDNHVFYHFLQVMNDWIYLSGQHNSMGVSDINRNMHQPQQHSNNSNSYMGYQQHMQQLPQTPLQIGKDLLMSMKNSGTNRFSPQALRSHLNRKFNNDQQVEGVIEALLNEGFLYEEDETYTIQ